MAYTLVPTELIVDGAVTSAKLDTNISISGTLGVTGELTLATHMIMGDNDKIKIGTGGDLEIYHDGSNSYISNSTGNIYLADTNGSVHIQAKLNEESIVCAADGAVTLYHDNAAKLATTATGAAVTGRLDVNLTGEGDAVKITGNSITDFDFVGNPPEFNLEDSGSTSGTKRARITVNDNQLQICSLPDDDTSVTNFLFYANLGNGNVGIGTSGSSAPLTVNTGSDGNNVYIDNNGTQLAIGSTSSVNYINSQNGSAELAIQTNGTERMRIDSSGNVGIGAAPVAAEGVFLQTGNNTISQRGFSTNIYYDGSNYRAINTGGSTLIQGGDNHLFYTAASASAGATQTPVERMRIDSSGNVGINATPNTKLHVRETGATIASGNAIEGSTQKGILLENTANDSTSLGLWYSSPSGNHQAGISFQRNDHINTWGTDIRFYTHENATVNVDYARERCRIDSEGNLLVGTTTAGAKFHVNGGGGSYGQCFLFDGFGYGVSAAGSFNHTASLPNGTATGDIFYFQYQGTNVGEVDITTTSTNYRTSSDYRLKENVDYEFNGLNRVAQLKPARFNFIADESNNLIDGFLAHEVQDIVPNAVAGEKDGEKMQSIDHSKLVPLLTKAIQEQQTIIDDLKSRIETLENE